MYEGKKSIIKYNSDFRKFKGFLCSLLRKLEFEVDLGRMNSIKN